MKKYIRTKDGRIFEIEKDLGKYGKSKAVIICDFNGNFIDVEKQNMMLKQADTIEELCDEFVVVNNKNLLRPWKITRKCYYSLQQIEKREHNDKCSIFGAIWTDKGLIYVAKMNEKGELELL